MRKIYFAGLAVSLASCAFSGTYLNAPSSRNNQSAMNEDIKACIAEATEGRVLSTSERALIEGKEASRFFKNGRPVVTPDGNPALFQSAFPQPNIPEADIYAVCLLNKGYKWAET